MSSNNVVNAVAQKLKYYFEVKRLEDGFDLSDVNAPLLDHPPLKSRPTLQYDGLHDRPLKHYFSQPEVRVQLTQLGLKDVQLQNPCERHIKKSLTKTMRRHQYLQTAANLPPVETQSVHQKSTIPNSYYVYTSSGMKIHPSMVGYGASPKCQRKKALKGGWPVMRSTPPVNISRGEAERLVNSAAKLLAATTACDLVHKQEPGSPLQVREGDGSRFKIQRTGSGKRRPLTAKCTSDNHSHRLPSARVKAYDDSYLDKVPRRSFLRPQRSPSPSSSTATEEERTKPLPLPPSPPPKPPTPPPAVERPSSKHRQRTIINMPAEKIRDEVKVTKRFPHKYETGSQTERHLLDQYDHNEEEVKEGPWGEYQIYVRTGDRIGASTSADVNITIYGEKGRTPSIPLTTSKHNKMKFQKGKEDLFMVAAHHVGKMRKVKIGHDRHQLSYAWYLESVTIYDMNDKQIYDFPCERWLSGQDDDHRMYRVLPVDRQRGFVDALEKAESGKPKRGKRHSSDSESSSDTEYEPLSQRKDKASMRPRRSQRSRDRSSHSGSSTSESETESEDDAAVVRMSAPSTPKGDKPEPIKETERKSPGTVIQFQKKGSQKVEEEVVLNEEKKEHKQQDFLAGYKAGVEAVEATERKQKEEERTQDRQLLSGLSIQDACHNGDLDRVKELLDKFPEMKDFKDESGWSPLHLAAAKGHVDIIKWLTSSGRDDIDVETPTGYTPIHVAAMNGHLNAIMVLNAMGADVGCKTMDKRSPLHLAARAGHLDCVKWLVANRSAVTAEDSFGHSPLNLAEEHGQSTVVDFLRVCERDLADPNSTFAQMHRAQHRGGSVALPTIKEDDKTSIASDQAQTSSSSARERRRSKDKEERVLKEKRQLYEKQQQHMQEQGASFLDSIRSDWESEP